MLGLGQNQILFLFLRGGSEGLFRIKNQSSSGFLHVPKSRGVHQHLLSALVHSLASAHEILHPADPHPDDGEALEEESSHRSQLEAASNDPMLIFNFYFVTVGPVITGIYVLHSLDRTVP